MPRKAAGETAGAARKKPSRPHPRLKPGDRRGAPTPGLSPGSGGNLRVKQVRSGIGHAETYRRTLRALGLRHYQHEVLVADTPSARGMLRKVWHLVRVRPAEA